MSLRDDLIRLREHLTRRADVTPVDDAIAWSIYATARLDPRRITALLAVLGPGIRDATHEEALRVIDRAIEVQP